MSTEATSEPVVLDDPRPRRWSLVEYYKLGDAGYFRDQHVELIDGEILQMCPMGSQHATACVIVMNMLFPLVGSGNHLRIQLPMRIRGDEPEPDVAIVSGSPQTYTTGHPTTALLIVEISDTSWRFDLTKKRDLYASAGVVEYWVLDVDANRLTVFRDVDLIAATYRTTRTYAPSESLSPLFAPPASILVADLLP